MRAKKIGFILFGIVLVAFDQITKYWAETILTNHTINLTYFFQLRLTYNTGIAFSFPFPRWILIVLTIGFLVMLFTQFWKNFLTQSQKFLAVLIGAGAFGNLIDRITTGAVIDFLSVSNFPIFNLADTYISLGVFGLLLIETLTGLPGRLQRDHNRQHSKDYNA